MLSLKQLLLFGMQQQRPTLQWLQNSSIIPAKAYLMAFSILIQVKLESLDKSQIKSSIQNSRLTVKRLLAKCKSIHQNTTLPASSTAGKDKRIILVDLDFHGTSFRTVTLMNMVSSILPDKMLGLIHGTVPFP